MIALGSCCDGGRRGSRWGVRALDGALVAALLATGVGCLHSATAAASPRAARDWALLLAGVVLTLLGVVVGAAAVGTARWLSTAHLGVHTTAASAALTSLRHRRNVGRRMPCPYPDAWYAVVLSAELVPGAVVDVTVCGRALVVFRPLSGGAPSALDAYCSHMGAHLAHGGGRLTDDGCIRCPFHGWCFGGDGKLRRTGTGDTPPVGADVRAWPVLERNGVVSVWMAAAGHRSMGATDAVAARDANGAAADDDERPWYEPPSFPELTGPTSFAYHGMSEHVVPALLWELPENGADIGHLSALHSDFVVPALRPLLSHAWAATWAADPQHAHLARLTIVESMVLLGVPLPGPVCVTITQVGPSQVFLHFNLPGIGRVYLIETVTPVAPATQRVLHAVFAARHIPRIVVKALLASVVRAYEQVRDPRMRAYVGGRADAACAPTPPPPRPHTHRSFRICPCGRTSATSPRRG